MNRIPQPPIQPARRATEAHEFWTGFIVAVVGVVLLICGARHLTGVETVEGATAQETDLVKAFSSGGLQYASRIEPVPPPKADDSTASQEALRQWQEQRASASAPSWKVRVDTGAKTPCPT